MFLLAHGFELSLWPWLVGSGTLGSVVRSNIIVWGEAALLIQTWPKKKGPGSPHLLHWFVQKANFLPLGSTS